ncbi:MAG: polyphenol oxidase family protein [Candidatus Cloacimonas acidaminovorans]
MKLFYYLGKREPDYRTLMHLQKDFMLEGIKIPVSRLVIAEQTHSKEVHICREIDCGAGIGNKPQIPLADGLITNIPYQYLLIRTADCYPILLMDSRRNVVAGLHCGREGTQKNIVGEAIRKMKSHFYCQLTDIIAIVGAGICHKHYEVSQELFDNFNRALRKMGLEPDITQNRHLNLRKILNAQLIKEGIPEINIENVNDCTFESSNYHSYRREKTNNRQINIVGILYG